MKAQARRTKKRTPSLSFFQTFFIVHKSAKKARVSISRRVFVQVQYAICTFVMFPLLFYVVMYSIPCWQTPPPPNIASTHCYKVDIVCDMSTRYEPYGIVSLLRDSTDSVNSELSSPELVFINILWRTQIQGVGFRARFSAKPN
jgi:hypothetical protein